jgi:phage-related protein
LSGIKNKIVSWKGPISDDRQLLVPAGQAIIGGLIEGLNSELPEVQATLQAVSSTVVSEMQTVRDAVNSMGFDIANALSTLRTHAMFTERFIDAIISRIQQKVLEGVSKIVSALSESSPEWARLADAVAEALSRAVATVNDSAFAIADTLLKLLPFLWYIRRAFHSATSDITEALAGLVKVVNDHAFSIADSLSNLRPHVWMTTQAFRSMASNISEVLAGLVETVNEKVFSISEALSQLRSQLSITARAFESSPLRSPTSFAAPQLGMEAVALRPGSVAPTPAAAAAPVINITVQERDVAGEVERVLRRVLFQAGW